MRLFRQAKLAKEAIGYSNQHNFNPAPAGQGSQGEEKQSEGYTTPYDCPDNMCAEGAHPLKIIGLSGNRVTALCEKSGYIVQLMAYLKDGEPMKNKKGQVIVQTEPTSNQAKLELSAKTNALNPLPAKRPRLKKMDDPTGLSTQVRRNDSIMNKTPNNMNSGDYEKVAQKRNIDGIPTKDSYKGPRVFRMHEDVGPQGKNTIAPFTKEREEYKNEHKVIQSTAAPIYGPDNLPPPPPIPSDGLLDGGFYYSDEDLDAKSDWYCVAVGGDGLEAPKIVKGRNQAEVYDFLSDRFPHVKSWDIGSEPAFLFRHDPDVEHLDVDADSGKSNEKPEASEDSMPQTMPLDSIQRNMKSTAMPLTESELEVLAKPHNKLMSETAKSKNLKTAAMYDQVSLMPGSGAGLCQWCPKLRASVQMTVCATKCIDGRRIPQVKPWENYSDYIANGGDPDGKVICGYKEWMAREMDKFYPGWVEDHIEKMGGEVSGSETNYGNRRMNLDEGERRHLPRYPEEKLIEKQMEVEERHRNNIYKTKTAGKTFSTPSVLKREAQWKDLDEADSGEYFLRAGRGDVFFVERSERLPKPLSDERYDEEWTHEDGSVVYIADNKYKIFQLAKELGFSNPAAPYKDTLEYESFCEEYENTSDLDMTLYGLIKRAYDLALDFLAQKEGRIVGEYDLFE